MPRMYHPHRKMSRIRKTVTEEWSRRKSDNNDLNFTEWNVYGSSVWHQNQYLLDLCSCLVWQIVHHQFFHQPVYANAYLLNVHYYRRNCWVREVLKNNIWQEIPLQEASRKNLEALLLVHSKFTISFPQSKLQHLRNQFQKWENWDSFAIR